MKSSGDTPIFSFDRHKSKSTWMLIIRFKKWLTQNSIFHSSLFFIRFRPKILFKEISKSFFLFSFQPKSLSTWFTSGTKDFANTKWFGRYKIQVSALRLCWSLLMLWLVGLMDASKKSQCKNCHSKNKEIFTKG